MRAIERKIIQIIVILIKEHMIKGHRVVKINYVFVCIKLGK